MLQLYANRCVDWCTRSTLRWFWWTVDSHWVDFGRIPESMIPNSGNKKLPLRQEEYTVRVYVRRDAAPFCCIFEIQLSGMIQKLSQKARLPILHGGPSMTSFSYIQVRSGFLKCLTKPQCVLYILLHSWLPLPTFSYFSASFFLISSE
jgi:hypothetical protein